MIFSRHLWPSLRAALLLTPAIGVFASAHAQTPLLSAALPESSSRPAAEPLDLPDAPQIPAAQTPQQPAQKPADAKAKPDEDEEDHGTEYKTTTDEDLKKEESQRMLGLVPAFNAVLNGEFKPLRPGQKFNIWFHSAVDPYQFTIAGIDSGIEQAENSYPEYHQGLKGYARRYGASYADSVDGNLWGNAILPVILHQDPRYFRLGHGTAWHRIGYTLLSTVRCKGDNGKWQFSYSNVGGNLIGGAISNLYYPASDRGVGLTLDRGFTVTAEGAVGAMALEFYPDAIAFFKRHHHAKNQATATP